MFVSKMWEMVEKIETDVYRLLLVLKMNKNFPIYFAKIEISFNFEIKSSLSTSVLVFSTLTQILKRKFYVLWTEICRNLKSIKFSNFLSIT